MQGNDCARDAPPTYRQFGVSAWTAWFPRSCFPNGVSCHCPRGLFCSAPGYGIWHIDLLPAERIFVDIACYARIICSFTLPYRELCTPLATSCLITGVRENWLYAASCMVGLTRCVYATVNVVGSKLRVQITRRSMPRIHRPA